MPIQPATATISGADPQRVEGALRQLAPKWTTGIVHTIAKYGPEMRVRDLAPYFPSVGAPFMSKRLATMHEAGLLRRDAEFDRTAPYRLSQRALTLGPVYRSLVQWSSEHIDRSPQGRSERIEGALSRLQPRHTTTVVQLLAEHGSLRFTHLAEAADVYEALLVPRLARLQEDGLVTRTGTRHGDPYTLTEAGQALGPVYASVQRWEERHTAVPTAPVPTAVRTLPAPARGSDGIRTAAALRRSAVPAALFSHSSQPQPRTPAAPSAASPARRR
ncbi:winged helix-turn-helix transcriptional regulator [Kitasatospora purpeofusca]|uniref:winged helix-turn-helix transcriptional regulator n=1 Tax=Kitasatospora purpeofusca TaxID=67352 RepID=UPI00225AA27F|nr:winged helix-turn-helix transcriptional regulator [Kitasatospora purpeofusca]MCX4752464.1 winged helix-turn-helix transcriptional regulator [Kitasatospora purpeofusca]WSR32035.1 winged helix-turn-helix transcriptional regulator [Kitasatospora purpeofusca]